MILTSMNFFFKKSIYFHRYINLIAPPNTYHNKTFNVYLATAIFTKDTNIVISYRDSRAAFRIRRGQQTQQNRIVEFASNDFSQTNRNTIGFYLGILVGQNGKCMDKRVPIKRTENEAFVFIQMDKPIYKPNDVVRFRVVAFNSDTTPISMNNIEVRVEDDDGIEIQNFNKMSDDEMVNAEIGLYENFFSLSENIVLGQYKISARVNKNPRIFTEKFFPVEKYTLPFFEVKIDVPEKVYKDDIDFDVAVYARYKFGEYASGAAKMTILNVISDTAEEELYYENFLVGTTKEIRRINIRNNLDIKIVQQDINIKINVDFNDDATKTTHKITKKITIMDKRKPYIMILKPYPYKPGLTYEFDVKVNEWNGQPIVVSTEPVKTTCKLLDGGGNIIEQKGMHEEIENNFATFKIETTKQVKLIDCSIEYKDAKIKDLVQESKDFTETLRVLVDKKT